MAGPVTTRVDLAVAPAQAAGEQARLRALAGGPKEHDRRDLARVAREFEGVFLNILVQSMRSTVPESGLMGSGGATEVYRQLHDTELARALAGTGDGLGIARLLEEHFADQFAEDEARGDLEPPAAVGPAQAGLAQLPASRAAARYRATALPRLEAAPRVQDLGELPMVTAPPAITNPAAMIPPTPPPTTGPAGTTPEEAGTRPPRPAMAPVDRSLAAAPLRAAEADTVRRFGVQIEAASRAAGLDPRLVLAVVMEESGGDPSARSRAGARGLMQLMPGTAADLGVTNPADPAANLSGGSRYLADQLERYDGRLDLALAAYNAGPGNVDRAGGRIPAFPETRTYVSRVMDRYARLRAGTELDKAGP